MITCVKRSPDGVALYVRAGDQRIVAVSHIRMDKPQSLLSMRYTCVEASMFYADGRVLKPPRVLQTSSFAEAVRFMFGPECLAKQEHVQHNV